MAARKWPEFKETDDAPARLEAMDRVMIVPRAEGDMENGKSIHQTECYTCHGADGRGRGRFPMLVGQYTNYLKKQVDAYLKAKRPHDEKGSIGVLGALKEQDIQDVLAYLTSIQNVEK